MLRVPLGLGETVEALLEPASGFDLGAGKGRSIKAMLAGGVCGLIFDCRGRLPFVLPEDPAQRIAKLTEWGTALDAYPKDALKR